MILGKNPALLKVTYIRPFSKEQRKECFQVLYLDDDDQVHFTEEEPDVDIFITKPEFRDHDYNKPEERLDRVNKVTVPFSKIRYEIAKEAGDWGKRIIDQANATGNWGLMNQLYRWPYAYVADFQPEFYYYKRWYTKYEPRTPHLSMAFLDIETDLMDYTVDLDHVSSTAYAPVNLISVVLEDTKEAWLFALKPYVPPRNNRTDEEYNARYDKYRLQLNDHEYLMSHKQEFYDDLHKSFDPTYGYLDYHIKEFDQEIELIADAFRLINSRKPNFCMIWNITFDIPYLIARIENLGYDPKSIMCHPDIPYPVCYFKEDHSTFELAKQTEEFNVSSYTQYICAMRLYAAIRKSQHKLRSLKLNYISDRELGDKKVDYPEAANIVDFPYVDWIKFCKYNIKDSLLMLGIERKTGDLKTYYNRSHSNWTPYNKIFKETHLLRNAREKYFEADGWVQGNNLNILGDNKTEEEKRFYAYNEDDDTQPESTFKGALVADPKMNGPCGDYIMGIRSNNIFSNAIDMDMSAFYPSIRACSNIDAITLLYKASLDNSEFQSGEFNNRSCNQEYEETDKNNDVRQLDLTGEMVNSYTSDNILTFGYNWLNLPSVTDLKTEIMKIIKDRK